MLDILFDRLYGLTLRRIKKSIAEFEALGGGQYIRNSDLQVWLESPKDPLPDSLLFKILQALGGDKYHKGIVRKYRVIMRTPKVARAKINALYIKNSLNKYQNFFDSVESNPLTEKQRISCLTDEDFNLVLAGAGSGKTSVIVARAGLIEKAKWASSKEVLILAFGKKAAEETQERVHKYLGKNSAVKSSTFHSLGLNIISKVTKRKPSPSAISNDEDKMLSFVDQYVEKFSNEDSQYAADLVTYFKNFLVPLREQKEFASIGEYYEHLNAVNLKTLKGEKVKSWQELHIANHLYCNSIPYEYEAKYEFDTTTEDFQQYTPDFYLTRSGVYIEHFGINKNGQPRSDFSTLEKQKYLEGIKWKRALHEEKGTGLIETTSGDFETGIIWEKLDADLRINEEVLQPLDNNAILESIREGSEDPKRLAFLISRFINLQKNNRLSLSEVKSLCYESTKGNALKELLGFSSYQHARLKAFYRVYHPVFSAYEKHLKEKAEIDFNDMINEATDYVLNGKFSPPWKFILVDEFQDISASRAALVKALVEKGSRCSLFCVGDDWQSIYRFTGSDINFTNNFNQEFGSSKTTALDKTFRFNQEISDLATSFVTRNPNQQKKEICALTQLGEAAVSVMYHGYEEEEKALIFALNKIKDQEIKSEETPSVYILSRFKFRKPEDLKEIQKKYSSLKIAFSTVHASKGKEADYVIALGINTERFGFPSEVETDPIIDLLLPPSENFSHAEERRLFYVALTRAKKRAYVLADRSNYSVFIDEITKGNNPLINEVDIDNSEKFTKPIFCNECKTGRIIKKVGRNGDFYGCNNYPYCKNKPPICPTCRKSPLTFNEDKVICSYCSMESHVCKQCLRKGKISLMIKREGSRGAFLGCSNYKGSENKFSCKNTEPFFEQEK